MKRLLLYFSYIGTNYKGLQRTVPTGGCGAGGRKAPDLESIQGILEHGLNKILQFPRDTVTIFTSSRTDTGVHALESTAQFDLNDQNFSALRGPYSPERICQSLNLFLEKNECDIRIQRIVEVPNNFSCRRAHSRLYEYRLAVLNEVPSRISQLARLSSATSIVDLDRCHAVCRPFDVNSVQEACKLFIGEWDFSSFMMTGGEVVLPKHRIKTIRRFSIAPEIIDDTHWDSNSYALNIQPYDIYKISIEGSGFLRKQVRRMVGCLVALGSGNIMLHDILWMLKNPSERNWKNNQISTLGPSGLFLKKINYCSTQNILRGYLSSQ